jgi:sarcosine oxidase, subunit alpha
MGTRRLDTGGTAVDRGVAIPFRFDGRGYEGLRGDTLASALMANGVDVVCASPILGRPRGIYSGGVEESSAFVEVSSPWIDPIVAATAVELVEGLVATGRAGVGRLPPDGAGATAAEHRHVHVETLVVGGGVAGLRAARDASLNGDRVMLVDERHWLGGTAPSTDVVDGTRAHDWVASVASELRVAPETTVLLRATATGVYDMGYVVVHERSRPLERVWHVRAGRIILATGAHERPIAFADNDRPGVMLSGAARLYADGFGVAPGERAVVFTTNHAGYEAAFTLADTGVEITAVIDAGVGGRAADTARERDIQVWTRSAVTGTEGDPRISAVHVSGPGGATARIEADLLLVSGGWNPAVQLWRAIGGGLRYDDDRACFVPDGNGPAWLSTTGAAAGDIPTSVPFWFTPAKDLSRHYVDLQRDSTVADVIDALGHDLRSVEHIKRATYIGTAVDQGRTSGVLTAEIVNQLQNAGPGAQGPTNARPPYTPIPYSVLAGRDGGQLLDPARVTPIHPWHVAHGAVFENVGQWKRPWYFPAADAEELHAAVHRECLAVRNGVGVMDASTLGKIDVTGPDAGTFLDRMYTNKISSLAVGAIRYAMMPGLDGMVFDDGVAMRLAEDRFLLTTTTGGAARVLDHLEEWLQSEWPDLRVYCTSVTEQWSTIALNGPLARFLLMGLGTDIDVSSEAFPWMTWRDGVVAGMAARVARVSFSGELAYEINVAGSSGLAMWEAVMAAGEPFGITPYGTESMHVLRAEKGFVIVGQETDGTVTPDDLGMGWIVNPSKGDFVGKRSLVRPDTVRQDRKQLVGLLPVDPEVLIPEGAQIVLQDTGTIPMPMVGHVTSSYRSAALGRTFALAMVAGGRALKGMTVFAPMIEGTIAAEVTAPIFYDPDGARRDG